MLSRAWTAISSSSVAIDTKISLKPVISRKYSSSTAGANRAAATKSRKRCAVAASSTSAAVAADVLDAATAQRFRDFVAAARLAPAVDEEYFRLITGFNDIFVSIATLLLLIAVHALLNMAAGGYSGAAVAAVSW